MLIQEKVAQAVDILNELDIDCWITFVRESSISHDPMLDFLIEADVTWHSAFIVTKSGETYAIIGQMELIAHELNHFLWAETFGDLWSGNLMAFGSST